MTDTKSEIAKGEYVIGIAIILAALLVSATIYISSGNLIDAIAKKSITLTGASGAQVVVNAQGAGGNAAGGNAAANAGANAGTGAAPAPSPEPTPVNIDVAGRPFKGGASAKVLIVEYSDFQCPFCSRALPTVNQMLSTYGDKVKFVYKHFPLEQLHPNAVKAAEASECARDQNKFWEMHDAMFADQNGLDNAGLKAKAAAITGMDAAAFNTCLDGGSKRAIVSKDAQEGSNYGVSGTPTFYINGKALVGAQPFSAFKPIIDAALEG